MRKLTLALSSFVAGVLCMFALGNHASTLLQPRVFAQGAAIRVEGAVPVVPPLRDNVNVGNVFNGGKYLPDGLASNGDTFNNVTFEYGGGAYKLENATVSGTVNIRLIGAAANTAEFLNKFGLIGCPTAKPTPKTPRPNDPTIMQAKMTTAFHGDIVSPFGQKK
jgi:hypothetical protein